MTNVATLSDIAAGNTVEPSLLEKVSTDFPYFAPPLLASLCAETDPDKRHIIKMKLAALIGNRKVLAVLLGEEPKEFLSFYPDEKRPSLSTDDTIASFLERYGDSVESHAEGIDLPIEAPAVDYAATFLAHEPKASSSDGDATSAALDAFLSQRPAPKPRQATQQPVAPAKVSETPTLTESFAQIMIKNHNYSKALEIIEALRLNNPEKSIYFADQIRFLRKLIALESKKTTKK